MNRRYPTRHGSPLRIAVALASCALLFGGAQIAAAQTAVTPSTPPSAKGTLKLQPRPSETSAIPSGTDGGTPGTSNSAPLGTAVTPQNAADRDDLKKSSAAARAAARKRPPAVAPAAALAASQPGDAAAASAASRR